jgi:hypothetical protein
MDCRAALAETKSRSWMTAACGLAKARDRAIPHNRSMHLLIPFAFCSADGCRQALPTLQLPNLTQLLKRLTPEPLDAGDEFSLSLPHERALSRALGLAAPDGLIPWAAQQAVHMDLTQPQATGAWAFITPCNWQIRTNHIAMSGAALPDFSEAASRTLLAAMQPYFAEDGIALHYAQPNRWLAQGAVFADLASASLDRVVGRNVENWIPRSPQAAALRRLQNEMQMLLYTHPENDAREAHGLPPVNSFWLSGSGALPAAWSPRAPDMALLEVSTLRTAALNEDWTTWVQAWQALDATECAALLAALARGENGQITLCGERHAQTWQARPQPFFKKFMNLFGTPPLSSCLESL